MTNEHKTKNLQILQSFLAIQKNKYLKEDTTYFEYDVFISAPIYSIEKEEFWEVKKTVDEIKKYLAENNKYSRMYYTGDLVSNEKEYDYKTINILPTQ